MMKNLIKKMVRMLLKILWVFPVKSDRVIFRSYNGRGYSCNPKYLFLHFTKVKHAAFEFIWCFNEPEKYADQIEDARLVKNNTIKGILSFMTAKYVVVNNGIPLFIPFRKEQIFVETWHGGGLCKKGGYENPNMPAEEKDILQLYNRYNTYFVSNCEKFTSYVIRRAFGHRGKVIDSGYPRNDILLDAKKSRQCREKLTAYYQTKGCNTVLYAPTYRKNSSDHADFSIDSFDIPACLSALEQRFGGKWIFLLRGHHDMSLRGRDDIEYIDVSDYEDMQELLCYADVLITDYSTSMWDFSLTFKPCLLYTPDLDEFESDRDFFEPIRTWGFPLSETNWELTDTILGFDEAAYRRSIEEHHRSCGSYDLGEASEAIWREVFEKCRMSKRV